MKTKTRFLLSAVSTEQFPIADADNTVRPEAAFIGRSNVGKSSLINAMVGTKMARVSSTPGRTQAINFFEVDVAPGSGPFMPMMIADLPGYGYAKVSRQVAAGWPKFIDPYLAERPQLKIAVLLVDSTIPAQNSDIEMVAWLRDIGRRFITVGTKSDKIGPSRRLAEINRLAASLGTKIVPVSATTGDGIEDLWRIIIAACRNRDS